MTLTHLKALLELLRDIMLFRRGPQDVPYSTTLLAAACIVAYVIDFAATAQFYDNAAIAAPIAVSVAAELLLVYAALQMSSRGARFAQTATALMGTRIVFTLITFPMLLGLGPARDPEKLTALQALLVWLLLPFAFWKLAVTAHVLRSALETSMRIGLLLALVFTVIEYLASVAFFPRGLAA
jgi:hypothetical protein